MIYRDHLLSLIQISDLLSPALLPLLHRSLVAEGDMLCLLYEYRSYYITRTYWGGFFFIFFVYITAPAGNAAAIFPEDLPVIDIVSTPRLVFASSHSPALNYTSYWRKTRFTFLPSSRTIGQ